MSLNVRAVRRFGLILAVPLCLAASGCSMYRGDFADRVAPTAVATTGAVDIRPAVLIQDGTAPAVSTIAPPRTTNVAALPALPKDEPAAPPKLLSADERARVIAELEALAREPAGGTVVKVDCRVDPNAKPGVAQTAAAATSCNNSPKPALRP